jgi:hypothetical protein
MPAAALALTLPMGFCCGGAQAADNSLPPSGTVAKPTKQDREMRAFSDAGHSAMEDIRDARLAIFEGEPRLALKMMESARTSLAQAQTDAPMFDMSAKNMGLSPSGANHETDHVERVPVDGEITLADAYVLSPDRQAHVNAANEHLKKGERAKALEELRLAAIDVNYTRVLMPIRPAENRLAEAIKAADAGKYYEANLALKAIEDSTTVDSITLSDSPKSANNKASG